MSGAQKSEQEALEWSRKRGSRASSCLDCGGLPVENRRYCKECRAKREKEYRVRRADQTEGRSCATEGCDEPRHVMKSQVSTYCLTHKNEAARRARDKARPRPKLTVRACQAPGCDQTFVWISMRPKQRFCSKACYEAGTKAERASVRRQRRQGEAGNTWCTGHKEFLANELFSASMLVKASSRCRDCQRDSQVRSDAKNPDKRRATSRRSSRARRFREYGITPEEFDALVAAQSSRCAICDDQTELVPDHCHKGGGFRGAICGACNTGLGMFFDDPNRLERASLYLR